MRATGWPSPGLRLNSLLVGPARVHMEASLSSPQLSLVPALARLTRCCGGPVPLLQLPYVHLVPLAVLDVMTGCDSHLCRLPTPVCRLALLVASRAAHHTSSTVTSTASSNGSSTGSKCSTPAAGARTALAAHRPGCHPVCKALLPVAVLPATGTQHWSTCVCMLSFCSSPGPGPEQHSRRRCAVS